MLPYFFLHYLFKCFDNKYNNLIPSASFRYERKAKKRLIPKIRKKCIDWENINAYWEKSEQREASGAKCGLLQIQLRGMGVIEPKKILQFVPTFKLGNSISST